VLSTHGSLHWEGKPHPELLHGTNEPAHAGWWRSKSSLQVCMRPKEMTKGLTRASPVLTCSMEVRDAQATAVVLAETDRDQASSS